MGRSWKLDKRDGRVRGPKRTRKRRKNLGKKQEARLAKKQGKGKQKWL